MKMSIEYENEKTIFYTYIDGLELLQWHILSAHTNLSFSNSSKPLQRFSDVAELLLCAMQFPIRLNLSKIDLLLYHRF